MSRYPQIADKAIARLICSQGDYTTEGIASHMNCSVRSAWLRLCVERRSGSITRRRLQRAGEGRPMWRWRRVELF